MFRITSYNVCYTKLLRKEMVSWFSTDTREEHICPHCAEAEASYVDGDGKDE